MGSISVASSMQYEGGGPGSLGMGGGGEEGGRGSLEMEGDGPGVTGMARLPSDGGVGTLGMGGPGSGSRGWGGEGHGSPGMGQDVLGSLGYGFIFAYLHACMDVCILCGCINKFEHAFDTHMFIISNVFYVCVCALRS